MDRPFCQHVNVIQACFVFFSSNVKKIPYNTYKTTVKGVKVVFILFSVFQTSGYYERASSGIIDLCLVTVFCFLCYEKIYFKPRCRHNADNRRSVKKRWSIQSSVKNHENATEHQDSHMTQSLGSLLTSLFLICLFVLFVF